MEVDVLFQSIGLSELNNPTLSLLIFLPSPLDDLSHAVIELDFVDQGSVVQEVSFEFLYHRKVFKVGDPVSLEVLPSDHVLMLFP
jgi:hypothetical protein